MNKYNGFKRKQGGITLIELMIAVVIVSILVSISYPSYTDYVVRVNRKQAMADLLNSAAVLERYKSVQVSYAGANDADNPLFNAWSPADRSASDKKYSLTLNVSADGRTYTLTATPTTGSTQAGDGNVIYQSDGMKGWDRDGVAGLSASEMNWE